MIYARHFAAWLMRLAGYWLVEWSHRVDGKPEE